jgi:diguanylate cyclase (GGDEF)-like protein/PAS domain S-box-containing protein
VPEFLQPAFRLTRTLQSQFLFAGLLLLALAALPLWQVGRIDALRESVVRTEAIERELAQLASSLTDADAGADAGAATARSTEASLARLRQQVRDPLAVRLLRDLEASARRRLEALRAGAPASEPLQQFSRQRQALMERQQALRSRYLDSVRTTTRNLAWMLCLAAVLGIALLHALTRHGVRRLQRPVAELLAALHDFSQGRSVAPLQARTSGADEIDQLRLSFNAMMLRLAHSEQQAARQASALLEHDRLLRLITDQWPGLVSCLDAGFRYRYANAAFNEWLGETPEALLGRPLQDVVGGAAYEAILPTLQRALAGETVVAERDVATIGGHRYCHVVIVPQRDARGEVVGVLAFHTDISDRRRLEQALQAQSRFLDRTGAVAGVGGWQLDLRSRAVLWSDKTCLLHDQLPGHAPSLAEALAYYAPASRERLEHAVDEGIRKGRPWDLRLELISARGRRFWARATGAAEFEDGVAVRLVGALQDITPQYELEQALARNRDLLQVTLASIGDAVITTDPAGRVTWLNPTAERLTGWPAAAAAGQPIEQVTPLVHAESRQPMASPVRACLQQRAVAALAPDAVLLARDAGEYFIQDTAAPIHDGDGALQGAVMVFHDVTEQRRLAREMSHRATHDTLTGLANRAEFEARLDLMLAHAREGGEHVLLCIDLDQFKVVNDACGHSAGDRLLRDVSQRLSAAVRGRDTVARLGGDEFGLLLRDCEVGKAAEIAQRICDGMDEYRFVHEGRRFRVGTSIGLVPIDARWRDRAAVLQAGDAACFLAKECGRNRVEVWRDSDAAIAQRQGDIAWSQTLQSAIDGHQFELYGQQVVPADGASDGARIEVLLRWIAPDGRIVAPGAFLPAAERFGLATQIDRWVVESVLGHLQELPRDCPLRWLSVNLSGQSIGDAVFRRWLMARLSGAGVDATRLCFEITETAAVTHLGEARRFVDEVRALGARVALDDFGAGASSFHYLKTLPVDLLKIDGQYIRDLLEDPLDDAAVRCFCEIAQALELQTVAEFVERPAVLARLRQLGVDLVQGFLVHRPEPLAPLLGSLAPPQGM